MCALRVPVRALPITTQFTGQPVLIGGTMGTCSYVLTGTARGMAETFGSTCHGAGRAMSRAKSRRQIAYTDVLAKLAAKGISIRVVRASCKCADARSVLGRCVLWGWFRRLAVCVLGIGAAYWCAPGCSPIVPCSVPCVGPQASPKLVMEEAPESYKDVTEVVNTCHAAGISNKCVKLRPIAVVKG